MAAQNHSWTLGEIGTSYGASSADRHKAEGQEDVAFTVEARQDIANTADGNTYNFSGAPDRVDVPDPNLPGCDDVDLGSVAPDTDRGVSFDLEGVSAPGAGGTGVLFRNGEID